VSRQALDELKQQIPLLDYLQQWRGLASLLHEAASFYRMQLHRHGEAMAYLHFGAIPARMPLLPTSRTVGQSCGAGLLTSGWACSSRSPNESAVPATVNSPPESSSLFRRPLYGR
jgi:hypothetical protein